MNMTIKVVVSCRDANGVPSFYACKIRCSSDKYECGEHYEIAQSAVETGGFESFGLAYDEHDGPAWLFEHFDWDNVPIFED
jgi:hypothetical protein